MTIHIEDILARVEKAGPLSGMTVNERLIATGLMDVFDLAKKEDKKLARMILQAIGVDDASIRKILHL